MLTIHKTNGCPPPPACPLWSLFISRPDLPNISLFLFLYLTVSNDDDDFHGSRRRRADEDDTILDSQEVSSVNSQDQGAY